MNKSIIGRYREKETLSKILESKKSEFVAIYGRRRVGKTYLIKEYFENEFTFFITALAQSTTKKQLIHFTDSINRCFQTEHGVFNDWISAIKQFTNELEKIKSKGKKVIFIDELPWFDTKKSDFITAIEFFWNSWASARKDIVFIVCGSAASWMINKLIKNTGGFYNRVTYRMKLEPFTLAEVKEYFHFRKLDLDEYQIIQIYMAMGGIPFYLEQVQRGESATQNIENICFRPDGKLRTEFDHIFSSLFKKGEQHESILRILNKHKVLNRDEIRIHAGLTSGGRLSKILKELEESGFIKKFAKYGQKKSNSLYSIIDFYSLFYFQFLEEINDYEENIWINQLDTPNYRTWAGIAFERICFSHTQQIKNALNIGGVSSKTFYWSQKGNLLKKGAQIDMIIDRRDRVINLFEIKFANNPFRITKEYDEKLRSKIDVFKDSTGTTKSVFLTMVTSFGLEKNQYSSSIVTNQLTMKDLFL